MQSPKLQNTASFSRTDHEILEKYGKTKLWKCYIYSVGHLLTFSQENNKNVSLKGFIFGKFCCHVLKVYCEDPDYNNRVKYP